MYDAALYYQQKSVKPQIDLPSKYILCTIHRAENTDNNEKLNEIFSALEKISKDIPVVMPIHPRTRGILEKNGYSFENSKICFIDPVGYFEMIWLITNSEMIMTDSGGLQKEAYFFKKKCVTLREQTEWVELLECGCNVLAGADPIKILDSFAYMKDAIPDFSRNLYGDGNTGSTIVKKLIQ